MRISPRTPPAGGVEYLLWLFLRVSGVAMLGLVVGHLYIMHVVNTTDTIDFAFVARRFTTPFWRLYDMLILGFALLHGLVGAHRVLDDYIQHRGWRAASEAALWIVGLVFLVMGAIVLVTFHPGQFAR